MTKIHRAIGIDLGTTNSVMAVLQGGEPKIISNNFGEPLTPSAVNLDKRGKLLVGKTAKYREDCILSVKRFMGLPYELTKKDQDLVNYKVGGKPGEQVQIHFNNRTYTPTQISAMILYQLRQDARERLGENVGRAVITVPAYFNDAQVAATREAGRMAGFTVMRILREPTAAAMAFGLERRMYIEGGNDTASVLVYDLGGGTFDISILMMMQGDYQVLGIEGDKHLGGDNFDHEIMKYIHQRAFPDKDIGFNKTLKHNLKMRAEDGKKDLSSATTTEITIPAVAGVDIEEELSRKDFNKLIASWIDRTIELMHNALREANFSIDMLDHILLVGGSTLIPLVTDRLHKEFGSEKIKKNIDPMLCVAFGAAIQTSLVNEIECPNSTCKDSSGYPTKNPVEATECQKCKTSLIGFDVVSCPVCFVPTDAKRDNCQHCKSSLESSSFETTDNISSQPKPISRHWKCQKCGSKNLESRMKCETCGTERDRGGLKCIKCGEGNPPGQRDCIKCGEPMGGITEATPENIGIELQDGRMAVLVKKNTGYPLAKPASRVFYTEKANETQLIVPIWQGSSDEAAKNEYVGEVVLEVPSGLPKGTAVTVSLHIDKDGVLFVTVQLAEHPDIKAIAHIARSGDREKLRRRDDVLKKARQIVNEGEEFPESKSIENRVRELELPGGEVSEDELERLEKDIESLKEQVDENKIIQAALNEANFTLLAAKDFVPTEIANSITQRVNSVRQAMAHGQKARAMQEAQDLQKYLDERPVFWVLAALESVRAGSKVSASLANRIGAALRELKSAQNDVDFKRAMDNVLEVWKEVQQQLGDQVPGVPGKLTDTRR